MGMTKTLRKTNRGFHSETTLIHGCVGVGKTLLAAQFPKAYFLSLENNNSYADLIHFDNAGTWQEAIEILDEFKEGKHDFKTIVIDGIDVFYNLCVRYYIEEYNKNISKGEKEISSLSDVGFAKAYDAVDKLISAALNPLDLDENYNLVLLAHTDEREITTLGGDTFVKLVPQVPGKRPLAYFQRLAQNIFYYYFVGDKRFLKIIGDDFVVAKNRGNGKFCTPENEPIVNVPMKDSPEDAYKYLIAAYNNKLKNSFKTIKS